MAISYHAEVAALANAVVDSEERRLTELAAHDPNALAGVADLAWDWRYRPTIVAAALVAMRIGRTNGKTRPRIAGAFNASGRHQQALEILAYPNSVSEESPGYWSAAATALAGVGRFHEAVAAAERARALGARVDASPWSALAHQQDALRLNPTWEATAAFAPAAVAVGAVQAAAEAIQALPPPPLDASEAQVDAMIALAHIMLETLPPKAAAGVVKVLRRLRADDERVIALYFEWLIRGGKSELIFADPPAGSRLPVRRLIAEARWRGGDRGAAIHNLGKLTAKNFKDHETKALLARYVGEFALSKAPPNFQSRETRKVFNLVPFNNELELLHLRLHEMGPWVDHFVIVEARSTFTGRPKPAWFEENKAQFAPYLHKISHVVIDAFPRHVSSAWARDYYQRDMALQGVAGLWAPQDIVLLTDADEIVRHNAIRGFTAGAISLRMKTYRFFLNYAAHSDHAKAEGHTGTICNAAWLAKYGASYLRFYLARNSKYWDGIRGAGWHFTSLGDAQRISGKFAAYAHQENREWSSADRIGENLAAILAGQYDDGWGPRPIDEHFPRYLRDNQALLRDLIIPVAGGGYSPSDAAS